MADRIRVLQVTGSLRIGGLENVAMNIIRYSDKQKYAFDYLVYGDAVEPLEAEVEALGGRVFHIPYPHKGASKYVREMKRIMREFGPYDVVHAHSLFNSGFVMKAAYDMGIPVRISHGHSDRRNVKTKFVRDLYNAYMRFLINRYATKKFACSEGAGKYLYGSGYGEDVYIVKNGVDVEKFRFDPNKRLAIKREFGWEDCKIIGHIGRLAEVKNQKKIIDVFYQAYQKDDSLRLLIAGDGELRETLQQQIDGLGLAEVAKLAGTRRDVPALLSAFDVYMMPSFYEGVSVSLIEAQVSGVHCLVSSNAASAETRLTDCLNIMELADTDDVWSEQIIQLVNKARISDSPERVKDSGYSIVDIVDAAVRQYGGENDQD